MKRITILIFVFAFSFTSFAQDSIYFSLTTSGLVNVSDSTKDFIVMSFPEKSQSELYNAVLKYATTSYVSPQDVISKIENEVITINGVSVDLVYFIINYTLIIEFKEGRMRIMVPTINKITGQFMSSFNVPLIGQPVGIYNYKGKLKMGEVKSGIENLFNKMIKNIEDCVINTNKEDDW